MVLGIFVFILRLEVIAKSEGWHRFLGDFFFAFFFSFLDGILLLNNCVPSLIYGRHPFDNLKMAISHCSFPVCAALFPSRPLFLYPPFQWWRPIGFSRPSGGIPRHTLNEPSCQPLVWFLFYFRDWFHFEPNR